MRSQNVYYSTGNGRLMHEYFERVLYWTNNDRLVYGLQKGFSMIQQRFDYSTVYHKAFFRVL